MRPGRLFAAFAIAAMCLPAALEDSPGDLALSLVRKAKRAKASGDFTQAYLYYSEAAALQPRNRKYRAAMEGMQARAAGQSHPVLDADVGQALPPAIADLPQPDPFDSITERELSQA